MTDVVRPRVKYVIGPAGSPLTIADLPPTNTRRWVIRRKAEVVAAVRGGLLSLDEACQRYKLTTEEFLSWPACARRASSSTATRPGLIRPWRPPPRSNFFPTGQVAGSCFCRTAFAQPCRLSIAEAPAVRTTEAAKNHSPGRAKASARPVVFAAKTTSATSTTSSIDQFDRILNQDGTIR